MKKMARYLLIFFSLLPVVVLATDCQQEKCDINTELSLMQENICSKDNIVCQTSDNDMSPTVSPSVVSGNTQAGNIYNPIVTGVDASRHYHYAALKPDRCDLNKLSNVPIPNTYIQERKKELDNIHQISLENTGEGVFLICITGFSGSGKTKLAIKYALEHSNDYHHTRIFEAKNDLSLLKSFTLFATSLCNRELDSCLDRRKEDLGNCVIVNVKRCLKEITSGKFLWIFDDVSTFEEIKKYIPNEQDIKGVILVTTQNNSVCFVDYSKQVINLNEGMSADESCALLANVIQDLTKTTNISIVCCSEEIENIAVKILGKFPLPIEYTGKLISEMESCKEYIETYSDNPDVIRELVRDIGGYKLQEELMQKHISDLSPLNLDIVGFLSFVETPFSIDLVASYISDNNEYRRILGLTSEIIPDFYKRDKLRAIREIKKFDLIKNDNKQISFPHELFRELTQAFLLNEDKKNPGYYKKAFDRATEFLCQKFSGSFWDRDVWKNKEEILLPSVEKVINVFMNPQLINNENVEVDKSAEYKKLQPFNDNQLALWNRLAKYYIQYNPKQAIKSFSGLLEKIVTNGDSSSKYVKDSISHALFMHSLVVAYCQARYIGEKDVNFNFDYMEKLITAAYEIFENKLGKEDPLTLNAYLILAHIKMNLKNDMPNEMSKNNYLVQFVGSEPTIDAALELSGFPPESKAFQNLKESLGRTKKVDNESYLPIYVKLQDKIKLS